jgi:hypothetical protein
LETGFFDEKEKAIKLLENRIRVSTKMHIIPEYRDATNPR